jgi:hypothetical protein
MLPDEILFVMEICNGSAVNLGWQCCFCGGRCPSQTQDNYRAPLLRSADREIGPR